MKLFLTLTILTFPILLLSQVPAQYDYPDTLWIYGKATDVDYGLTPEKAIKVGGGLFPKHIYRYLNSLTDTAGKKVSYKRIGSCCNDDIQRKKPLTSFTVTNGEKNYKLYFDLHEWEEPKLLKGFEWKEKRSGYYGEYKNDTIFDGYGIYFFPDGGYYKGNWKNGMMNGYGEMFVIDVEKYEGTFKDGKYHGKGILHFLDGGYYVGQFVNTLKEGKGKLVYPPEQDIKFIEGTFTNDAPTGVFTVVNKDGTKKTSEF